MSRIELESAARILREAIRFRRVRRADLYWRRRETLLALRAARRA